MAHLAYKFRLYPTATQEASLLSQLETLRRVYNTALAMWRQFYARYKAAGDTAAARKIPKKPTSSEVYRHFSSLRNEYGDKWLAAVAAVPIRDICKRVERAFANFFRRVAAKKEKAGYPRFKGYGQLRSIPFDNYGSGCGLVTRHMKTRGVLYRDVKASRRGYRLNVFGVGRAKVNAHRDVPGEIKTACVEREPDGKWYVVLTAETPDRVVEPKDGLPVGIDVGLEHFLTTSDGEHRPNPRVLASKLKELRRLQRSSSRKAEAAKKRKAKFRECKNLQKSFRKVARLHTRVKNLRKENHHKEAILLVRRYGTVCVESLNVKGMLRNGKLSRAISDAGWSGFVGVLRHKAERAGVRFVEVDARGTSQECPECGGGVQKTLKVRTHNCPHCGYSTHRDHAAARVILARGLGHGFGQNPAGRNPDNSRGAPRSLVTVKYSSPHQYPREGGVAGPVTEARKSSRSRGNAQQPADEGDRSAKVDTGN